MLERNRSKTPRVFGGVSCITYLRIDSGGRSVRLPRLLRYKRSLPWSGSPSNWHLGIRMRSHLIFCLAVRTRQSSCRRTRDPELRPEHLSYSSTRTRSRSNACLRRSGSSWRGKFSLCTCGVSQRREAAKAREKNCKLHLDFLRPRMHAKAYWMPEAKVEKDENFATWDKVYLFSSGFQSSVVIASCSSAWSRMATTLSGNRCPANSYARLQRVGMFS